MVVLGIDIGGAQIKAGMVDEAGAILASRTIETPGELDSLLPLLHDAIDWLMDATANPAAVGVGCKGIIDPDSTRVERLPAELLVPTIRTRTGHELLRKRHLTPSAIHRLLCG